MGCSTPDAVSEPAGAGGDRRPGSWDSPGTTGCARQRPGTPHRSHARHDHQNPASPRCSSATFRNGTRRRPRSSLPGAPAGAGTPPVTSTQETHHGCIPLLAAGYRFSPQFQRLLTADAQARLSASSALGWRRARLPAKRRKAGGRRSARCVRMGRAGLLGTADRRRAIAAIHPHHHDRAVGQCKPAGLVVRRPARR